MTLSSQGVKKARIYFKPNSTVVDFSYMSNKEALKLFDNMFSEENISKVTGVYIISYSSPSEGYNNLSMLRSKFTRGCIRWKFPLAKTVNISMNDGKIDWNTMLKYMKKSKMTSRLKLIENTIRYKTASDVEAVIKFLDNGKTYRYIRNNVYPYMRAADVEISYVDDEEAFKDVSTRAKDKLGYVHYKTLFNKLDSKPIIDNYMRESINELSKKNNAQKFIDAGLIDDEEAPDLNSIKWAIIGYRQVVAVKTNMLYNAVTAPNIEYETILNNRWSLAIEGIGSAWDYNASNKLHIMAGFLELRYALGVRRPERRLEGFYLGVYVGYADMDICYKSKGYRGNIIIPEGFSVGYSHRISRHIALEYSIGCSYIIGDINKYDIVKVGNEDNNYIEIPRKSSDVNRISVTKAKVSISWIPRFLNRR